MNNGPEWMDEERSGVEISAGADAAPETEVAAAEAELLAMDPEVVAMERELREGLKPFALPMGFADRVVAAAERVEVKPRSKVVPFRSVLQTPFRTWRLAAGGAIAASVLAGSFAIDQMHERHERERAQVAEQQLETAVQVSNRALDEARAQLQRAAFRLSK